MVLDADLGVKLIFLLGLTNLISIGLIFLSCRCLAGGFLSRYKWYPKFFNLHCYFWWIFIISVILHATIAFLVFGIPI